MKVKGWELMKMIADGEIKAGSKFKFKEKEWYFDSDYIRDEFDICFLFGNYNDTAIINGDFEILEDEINIDKIKELKSDFENKIVGNQNNSWSARVIDIALADKINELIKAVKQLNKRIGEYDEINKE